MTDDIKQACDTYNIVRWSEGYFDINQHGQVVAYPDAKKQGSGINLAGLTDELAALDLAFPILIRFPDILKHRIQSLCKAFSQAVRKFKYTGNFTGVYPIKVNQQRRVVEEIVRHGGKQVGLEAGSKPELMAVLGLLKTPAVVICNGYKDRDYIRLALIGIQFGHDVHIVVDKLSEVDLILEESARMNIEPKIGVRVRLATIASGKWMNTSGAKSKFGLSAGQVLQMVEKLRAADKLELLQLLHFNLGSQIANIHDIRRGIQECARYYVELRRLGVDIRTFNVGGGLAVDYEGTSSVSACSMNYTIQEYANSIVHMLTEICAEAQVPHPNIITESGRAMTAHHAMLVTNVIDIEQVTDGPVPTEALPDESMIIHDLWSSLVSLTETNALETYHNATYWMSTAQTLYSVGRLNLTERARAESIYLTICGRIRDSLKPLNPAAIEVLEELNEKLADKLFCNFSLFQSLPDVWAIDQIFPVLPLSGLNQKLSRRGVLQDITCDSDGRIDQYVEGQELKTTLALPPYQKNAPCLLGIFLVGAYQEILGDMHNLFGDTDSVQLELMPEGTYRLIEPTQGDEIEKMLRYVHFDTNILVETYKKQLARVTTINEQQRHDYLTDMQRMLHDYTYLKDLMHDV